VFLQIGSDLNRYDHCKCAMNGRQSGQYMFTIEIVTVSARILYLGHKGDVYESMKLTDSGF
jgi:hypothetical protein